jgi:hypothetical protein
MTEQQRADHQRDLDLISRLDRLSEDPEFPEASFCLRLDVAIDGNLSARPAGLADLLVGAYDLMQPSLVFYGAENLAYEGADGAFRRYGFPQSGGRKPRANDRQTLARIAELMAEVEAADAADLSDRLKHLTELGLKPDPAQFSRPRDGGNLVLADGYPLHLAQNLIYLTKNRSECWSVSIGFSPALWRAQSAAIGALLSRFAASGAYDSGSFGFALNSWQTRDEVAERLFRPVTRRFPMLNPMQPGGLCLTAHDDHQGKAGNTRTHVPVGCWTMVSRDFLQSGPVSVGSLEALRDRVAAVDVTKEGVLVKLWHLPVLGDVNHAVSLAAAKALQQVLAPLRIGKSMDGLADLKVGYEADRDEWLKRLVLGPP